MIDIHTHILPYVDDGAENWDAALKLLKQGEKQGIVAAVATPHILSENDYKFEDEIIEKFNELKQKAKANNIKMMLYLGCEIYAQQDMTINHKISTTNNNKKYFLVEFPMSSIPRFVSQKFFDFIVDGKIPVIAHPERNIGFMKRSMLAYEFVQRGALMQVNAGSIIGKHGEKAKALAHKFIDNNLVHFVGSDCHDPNRRSMSLAESYEVVKKIWGSSTARMLFFENPKKYINGDDIDIPEPLPLENDMKKSFWSKILNPKKQYSY